MPYWMLYHRQKSLRANVTVCCTVLTVVALRVLPNQTSHDRSCTRTRTTPTTTGQPEDTRHITSTLNPSDYSATTTAIRGQKGAGLALYVDHPVTRAPLVETCWMTRRNSPTRVVITRAKCMWAWTLLPTVVKVSCDSVEQKSFCRSCSLVCPNSARQLPDDSCSISNLKLCTVTIGVLLMSSVLVDQPVITIGKNACGRSCQQNMQLE